MGRKRTEITIETERIIYISSRCERSVFWCEKCAKRVPMLSAEEAAVVLRVHVSEIFRRIENGELHYVQINESPVRICPNSLVK
ncbi:MAG: hypothetical protein ICV60_15610 [Pyrinomonadaceae bacterium]|nr:hypothetical protein [Pyrinomonadaceae bacterium]